MNSDYFLREDGSFIVRNYNSQPPFSNFLPGVAGTWGVPIWVFYVNRAQGVISFGIKDRDHAITEFFPANNAYCFSPLVGFRTFLKINNTINYEPFRVISDHERNEEMVIRSSSFGIRKNNPRLGLNLRVKYFTLPNTSVGALVRVLSIKNTSHKEIKLEVIDGLPKIVPFGLIHVLLKDLARTLEAWMRVHLDNNLALFRLIVDPTDASQTRYVDGANFNYAFYEEKGKKIFPNLIVDPSIIFAQDTSYSTPIKFYSDDFHLSPKQVTAGKTPCAFSHFTWKIKPQEVKLFYSIFGAAFKQELIKKFTHGIDAAFLKAKENENEEIIERIKSDALCVSSSRELSNYVPCSFLDNVLRGGYPYKFDTKFTYYIFSRKHGDLERDYNRFKLLPSDFSEGEANYRDINQNRRMDLFFNPTLGKYNIAYFLNLIKMDGYNPLLVRGEKLFFGLKHAKAILKDFRISDKKVLSLLLCGFHLGEFFKLLKEEAIAVKNKEKLARILVEKAHREPQAEHAEGYWIDHWRYNLDLIENYLYFYPDKLKELFLEKEYYFWDDEYRVKERSRHYHHADGKVYQWHCLEEIPQKKQELAKRGRLAYFLRDKKGTIYRTNLVEKLLVIILNKLATLDPYGIGIEMEADKPGWCDSLNGLPALFGSSLCETLELKRACLMLCSAIEELKAKGIAQVKIAQETDYFFKALAKLLKEYLRGSLKARDFLWWKRSNFFKERFRNSTFNCVSGRQENIQLTQLGKFLSEAIKKLDIGIEKARDKKNGLYYTYFRYEAEKYNVRNQHAMPLSFKIKPVNHFLEGAVHLLRTQKTHGIYEAVRRSGLFDAKLKMYRLNMSLKDEPLEIGRSRIFLPGWLENESIWLHMEYKYLLEVLKNGFYEDFYNDFYNCGVCFFEPKHYGRNILENSSFIVSSAHPDKDLWGKGFVARLSGATVEVLNIWILMCLGQKPFFMDEKNNLGIKFNPILKAGLFTLKPQKINHNGKEINLEKDIFAFKLFSHILVVYHNPNRKDTFSKTCRTEKIILTAKGKQHIAIGETILAPLSYAVRDLQVERIDVYFD
jgi:hypothetical protein